MSLSSAPMTVHSSGQMVATDLPTLTKGPPAANIPGGILNAAAAKTAESIKEQAAHAKAAGAGMRGGGTPINVSKPPEGGTIPGVSFADNHAKLIGAANQLKASAVYDGLIGSQPYKVSGGRRHSRTKYPHRKRYRREFYPMEEPVIAAGRKHTRKIKNVRRRRTRTIRRRSRRSSNHSRRSSLRSRKR